MKSTHIAINAYIKGTTLFVLPHYILVNDQRKIQDDVFSHTN